MCHKLICAIYTPSYDHKKNTHAITEHIQNIYTCRLHRLSTVFLQKDVFYVFFLPTTGTEFTTLLHSILDSQVKIQKVSSESIFSWIESDCCCIPKCTAGSSLMMEKHLMMDFMCKLSSQGGLRVTGRQRLS